MQKTVWTTTTIITDSSCPLFFFSFQLLLHYDRRKLYCIQRMFLRWHVHVVAHPVSSSFHHQVPLPENCVWNSLFGQPKASLKTSTHPGSNHQALLTKLGMNNHYTMKIRLSHKQNISTTHNTNANANANDNNTVVVVRKRKSGQDDEKNQRFIDKEKNSSNK